ncbi:serine/threonine-protein kinase [Lentisphaera profundi]|uniref:Serine/threonine-protein kinase n=1 Tax=Lentisphaera profundi TaxID=1658616 RepID=A0ABY7VUZ1_9BACT|nr:serine/threonine-protein kinase [Lentisphaera profundi]WDE96564.1 serine/threonine-protein kinase [Lentisphaera profundi]
MSDLEEAYQQRDGDFRQFYQFDKLEEMAESSFPILDSLQISEQHYSEEEFITQGGEKKIFRVRDLLGDRYVALARPIHCETKNELESFLREARITSFLQHPNILSVHEMNLDAQGIPFFTMEFMNGQSLAEILEKLTKKDAKTLEEFPLNRLIDIFQKVCSALSYAHSKNILHLDIKPANIQVGEHGEVLLCDWGIAQIQTGVKIPESSGIDLSKITLDPQLLNDHTLVGAISGSPGFICPEKIHQKNKLSPASDIYAMGSLLYYLLSHQMAFSGSNEAIIQKTLKADFIKPSLSCNHAIPRSLEAICLKAMALDPKNRYQSIKHLEDDLELYRQGFPTLAQNANPLIYLKSWSRRHSKSLLLSSFFSLLIGFILFLAFEKINTERLQAITEKQRAEENLQLFKQQEAATRKNRQLYELENKLSALQADHFFETISNLYDLDNYTDATKRIKAINKHLEREHNQERLKILLAYKAGLYFVLQNYPDCIKTLDKINIQDSGKLKSLYDLSNIYVALIQDNKKLSSEQLESLTLRFPNHIQSMLYYTYYYHTMNSHRKPEENVKIAEALLNRINLLAPQTDRHIKLKKFKNDLYHLDLSHHEYRHLSMPIAVNRRRRNLLLTLHINQLDLSHTRFNDGSELIGYNLDELHIRGIKKISNLRIIATGRIKKIYHNLELSDQELLKTYPKVKFIRVSE